MTINENGTGYYYVLPASLPVNAEAPSVATVLTGTSFAMTANVAATKTISGLVPWSYYTVYFVAKDSVENGQATVSSASFRTVAPVLTDYISQGGLTSTPNNVMPPNGYGNWASANAYCTTTTINGQTGRLPNPDELVSLYNSGALAGQG